MKIVICKSVEELGRLAATRIAEVVRAKPRPVLGLATGSTPLPTYRELIRLHREEGLSFAATGTFNLDEYVGLAPDHAQSYRRFMQENLFDSIDIDPANTHVPDGRAADIEDHCAAYERMIAAAGGIDCQVLGIGSNGHVGFNEPGTPIESRTHRVGLTDVTRQDNARFFETIDEVPTEAITMGIGTILEARSILLLASGANKVKAIAATVEGSVSADVPASALQRHHDVTVILTEDVATGLSATSGANG